MKGASWLVAGGTVAGLVAVLSYHSETMPATALGSAAPASPAPSTTPSATASGTASGTTSGSAASTASGTATGPSEQFGYGSLSVSVTVQGGRITKISVPSLQTAEPTSQQISDQAIPMLTSEIMSAQSLNVNAISGATYTSDAYAQSLQAALDKLHFK
jgi:uncharacterized protein with FMN-binding domain